MVDKICEDERVIDDMNVKVVYKIFHGRNCHLKKFLKKCGILSVEISQNPNFGSKELLRHKPVITQLGWLLLCQS